MPMLLEQLLLDDSSQIVEKGNFFEKSSEGIIPMTDENIFNCKVFNKSLEELSEQLFDKEILNIGSSTRYLNIKLSYEFRDRKEELIIDSFYYQINFNVDFTLNYFKNISKIYLIFYPSFKYSQLKDSDWWAWMEGRLLDIGVTGYICYELIDQSCHRQEKLSFKPRIVKQVNDLWEPSCVGSKVLPIRITDLFKYRGNLNENIMLSFFKEEIVDILSRLINVD